MSLRWRLTLYYGFLCGIILLLGNFALFLALRSSLHTSLDTTLKESAQLAASQLSGDDEKPKIETTGERIQASLPGATTLTVFNANGQQIDQFGVLKIKAKLEPGFQTINDVRIYTEILNDGGWLQAARSQIETANSLSNAAKGLMISIPVLLLLGLLAGYFISDRALRPVDAVTRLAQSIATSGKSGQRVPPSTGDDEMARLTQTVNQMLEKLEKTIQRERAFALAAAHELRTPLTILRGRTSLTLERRRTIEQYENALQEIDQTAADLNATVESLLALASSNQPAQQVIYLNDLAFDGVELARNSAQTKDVQIELDLKPAKILGDPNGLRIAISNLLENAIKYGKHGGHVWISTGATMAYSWISISDDGLGIPSHEVERLLQPFQRGTALQSVSGAGLGLALVSAIVDSHNGKIEFEKSEHGGLMVTIKFFLRS